jgi:hypothetical protein
VRACVVPLPACQQRLVWACVVVVPFLACHEFLVWVWNCPCALIIMQQRVGLCLVGVLLPDVCGFRLLGQ